MQLARLRSFVLAVDLGSLNAAASELSYTAPAVSQHISSLEDELGCELLIRRPSGVTPTDAGKVLYERAREIIELVDVARQEMRELAGELPRLRIGSFPTASRHLLPDVLSRLRELRPSVELSLFDFEPPGGVEELAGGRLDVLVTNQYPGLPDHTNGSLELVMDDPLLLVGGTDSSDPVEISTLEALTWISGPPGLANRIALEKAAERADFVPLVGFETNEYDVTVNLASRGFGVALVPRVVLAALAEPPPSAPVVVAGEPLARRIGVTWRRPLRSSEIELFVDELHAVAGVMTSGDASATRH